MVSLYFILGFSVQSLLSIHLRQSKAHVQRIWEQNLSRWRAQRSIFTIYVLHYVELIITHIKCSSFFFFFLLPAVDKSGETSVMKPKSWVEQMPKISWKLTGCVVRFFPITVGGSHVPEDECWPPLKGKRRKKKELKKTKKIWKAGWEIPSMSLLKQRAPMSYVWPQISYYWQINGYIQTARCLRSFVLNHFTKTKNAKNIYMYTCYKS